MVCGSSTPTITASSSFSRHAEGAGAPIRTVLSRFLIERFLRRQFGELAGGFDRLSMLFEELFDLLITMLFGKRGIQPSCS